MARAPGHRVCGRQVEEKAAIQDGSRVDKEALKFGGKNKKALTAQKPPGKQYWIWQSF